MLRMLLWLGLGLDAIGNGHFTAACICFVVSFSGGRGIPLAIAAAYFFAWDGAYIESAFSVGMFFCLIGLWVLDRQRPSLEEFIMYTREELLKRARLPLFGRPAAPLDWPNFINTVETSQEVIPGATFTDTEGKQLTVKRILNSGQVVFSGNGSLSKMPLADFRTLVGLNSQVSQSPTQYGRNAKGALTSRWDGTQWVDLFTGKPTGAPVGKIFPGE